MTRPVPHPAKYSDALFPVFSEIVEQYKINSVLDPMAGTGKIGLLRDYGFVGRIVANEIEWEWANQAPEDVEVHIGDAADMQWATDGEFDAIITSPVYGNRMSDSFESSDGSKRLTYRHRLGRPLHPVNTGQLHFPRQNYKDAHRRIWKECMRVLKPGGIFVLNTKDFYAAGVLQRVGDWHCKVLSNLGLQQLEHFQVDTPGMRFGANHNLRVEHEDVWVFEKEATL